MIIWTQWNAPPYLTLPLTQAVCAPNSYYYCTSGTWFVDSQSKTTPSVIIGRQPSFLLLHLTLHISTSLGQLFLPHVFCILYATYLDIMLVYNVQNNVLVKNVLLLRVVEGIHILFYSIERKKNNKYNVLFIFNLCSVNNIILYIIKIYCTLGNWVSFLIDPSARRLAKWPSAPSFRFPIQSCQLFFQDFSASRWINK